jgi:hypothetical protein
VIAGLAAGVFWLLVTIVLLNQLQVFISKTNKKSSAEFQEKV